MPNPPPKIPYAERNGELVHVSQVARGLACNCVCPLCKARMVARQGTKRTSHFGHAGATTCTTETLFHELGRRLLYERITSALNTDTPIPIIWKCSDYRHAHEGNLLRRAARVLCERALGPTRPDLLLLDAHDQPVAVIEVVVTHAPEPTTSAYYLDHGLPVLQFCLRSMADFEALTETPLHPILDKFECCFTQKLSFIDNYRSEVKCPKQNQNPVKVMEHCVACEYLIHGAPVGIVCFGKTAVRGA